MHVMIIGKIKLSTDFLLEDGRHHSLVPFTLGVGYSRANQFIQFCLFHLQISNHDDVSAMVMVVNSLSVYHMIT